MSGTDPDRSRRIFLAALELPVAERDAFLTEQCGGSPELIGELRAMLRLHETSDRLLDQPALAAAGVGGMPGTFDRPLSPGDRLGRYTITGVLGEGGMGRVYRARQRSPQRDVALKVVRDELVSRATLKRFAQEAAALGRLQHPGIARVLEASGHERDGADRERPFIAMELVTGEPITAFARRLALTVRQRVELFRRVCDAVHHAHVRGVVHRDIKPGNIIVDGLGEPRVLDFGVARLVGGDGSEGPQQTAGTHAGQIIGTLAYMSPEQASGDPGRIDSRADVYALGAVLYELLCGRPPIDIEGLPLGEALARLSSTEPARPAGVDRSLAGDLEAILMRALEKDPARRYQHASDLSEDLRRHLADESIVARPPTAISQIVRFARRNRLLAGSAAAVALVLVVSVVFISLALVKARDAEQKANMAAMAERASAAEARRQTERAERTSKYLRSILEMDPARMASTDHELVRKLLDEAVEKIGTMADDPGARATVLSVIGNAYMEFGFFDRALPLQRRAVQDLTAELGPNHPDTLWASDSLGGTLIQFHEFAEARLLLESVRERRRATEGPADPILRSTLNNLIVVCGELMDERAVERYAAELVDMVGKRDGPSSDTVLAIGSTLAQAMIRFGRFDEAEPLARQGYEAQLRRLGERHPHTLSSMQTLAMIYLRSDRADQAVPLLARCLELTEEVQGKSHLNTVTMMIYLIRARCQLKQYEEALPVVEQLMERAEPVFGPDHPNMLATLQSVGLVYRGLGRFEKAEPLAGRLVADLRRIYPNGSPKLASALLGHAECLRGLGRRREEIAALLEAWHEHTDGGDPDPDYAAEDAVEIADAYEALGDSAGAAMWRERGKAK